jgi:aspartate aminotransferase
MAGTGDWGLKIAAACAKLQGQCTTSIPPFIMAAVRHAILNCDADVERMRVAFAQRGELIHGLASRIPGLRCARPTGAYYLFPDVSCCFGRTSPAGARITGAASFAEAFLNEHHVAVVPGEDFGAGGEKCVRFTFSCGDEQIREGVRRLGEFMASLR